MKLRMFAVMVSSMAMTTVVLAGCSSAAQVPKARGSLAGVASELSKAARESSSELVARAATAGPVEVYTDQNATLVTEEQTAVERAYPSVTVQFVQLTDTGLTARFDAEFTAGRGTASLIEAAGDSIADFVANKELAPYRSPESKGFPAKYLTPTELYTADSSLYYSEAYNTADLRGADLPTTLQGMATDAALDGEVGMTESAAWVADVLSYYGRSRGLRILEDIAKQKPKIFASNGALRDALIAGSVKVAYDTTISHYVQAATGGAPVAPHVDSPAFQLLTYLAIPSDAPNPYGAALVYNWILAKSGAQSLYAKNSTSPVTPGAANPYSYLVRRVTVLPEDVGQLHGDAAKYGDLFVSLYGD